MRSPAVRHLALLFVAAASLLALAGCGADADSGSGDEGPPQAGTYGGTTSQGLPIAFSVSAQGRVTAVQFGWRARCADGLVHVNTIVLPGGSIENGSFRTGGPLETGGIAHVTGTFDGREAGGELSRSQGTAFGVNCRVTGITWTAQPGPWPPMPPPSTEGPGAGTTA